MVSGVSGAEVSPRYSSVGQCGVLGREHTWVADRLGGQSWFEWEETIPDWGISKRKKHR